MPRTTRPPLRTRVLPAVIATGAVVAVGTAVVLNDQPTEQQATTTRALVVDDLFRDSFEGVGCGAPVPPAETCIDPLVSPPGFRANAMTWAKMWSSKRTPSRTYPVVQMQFPDSPGFPVGIGAGRNEYQLTSFVAPPNTTAELFFDPHQARPQEGEPMGRPAASMFISVSPCVGDFRLRFGCAISANTGALIWTTRLVPAGTRACALTAGKTYHLLVAPVAPHDGNVIGDYTCRDPNAPYCWVQAKHSAK
jgi:hypothetical protein